METYKRSFRQLIVWQKAKQLSLNIYEMTKRFPDDEKFGMISQMRRAALSIQANIAEGNERSSYKDCRHFMEISRGSLVELDCFVDFALELQYISEEEFSECMKLINLTGYFLHKFKESQQTNPQRRNTISKPLHT